MKRKHFVLVAVIIAAGVSLGWAMRPEVVTTRMSLKAY